MLVSGVSWDLNWFLQLIFSAFVVAVGLHTLVKKTASKYFEVDANFEGERPTDPIPMPGTLKDDPVCVVCGNSGTKKCSRCKAVRYCSQTCQQSHWNSGHKSKCKDVHLSSGNNSTQAGATNRRSKASAAGGKNLSSIALVPASGTSSSRPIKHPKSVLFPYDEFVKFFNWDKPGFPPCGLLNCGNSCFANVVLQCLSFTKPLVAYLMEKGHRQECSFNGWCFLCEFQAHLERVRQSSQAFSPMHILSGLHNIGGDFGYGSQEDAHEFMRFAIDTMQSVCLDEFGGERAVPSNVQETTLIQHIFGGHLQSQVICTQCDKVSNQYENMMDLTVEIHGDAASLEECLDQFTVKEWLHGENMYKCDGCNDYVKAWKRLTVKSAPNILTIALKRFQSGRFGKLNKRITFPETLNLSPYMSEAGDGSDVYKLYAVVVHLDMLNASFFGHYICYIKGFRGNWYRIDDCKVVRVELEEVLSQGAYMLLYSRISARPSGLQTSESLRMPEEQRDEVEVKPGLTEQPESISSMETVTCSSSSKVLPSDISSDLKASASDNDSLTGKNSMDVDTVDVESTSDFVSDASGSAVESPHVLASRAVKDLESIDTVQTNPCSSPLRETSGCIEEQGDTHTGNSDPSPGLPNGFSCFDKNSYSLTDHRNGGDSGGLEDVKFKSSYGNGYSSASENGIPVEEGGTKFSGISSLPTETSSAKMHQLKRGSPLCSS
ncbi:ubiquitin carboxyl-terminal hydrolase 18 [Neltuma alba]|uniref:ubiquitin carboxyl-terminal hydrolase 18 n=1 Tax=Neltuma alba TaxID=207710 RepID=UPI0010A32FD5|nr:ubiquitin carboxyl-terminal hydrolase 18-like [Prosopis alba]XP_028777373.1 ubiquitin carboxyl-terminal hydrolase 18-like [Prosopis alba]